METQETPFKAALRSGMIVGLISLVISYLVYFINATSMASSWMLLLVALSFVLVLVFGFKYRKELGGYIPFGAAFQFSFFTLIVAGIIGMFGQILLFEVIDPSLPEVLVDQQIQNTMEVMENFGAADAMSTEQIDEMKQGLLDRYSFAGQIKAFGFVLIFYAIIALILGAIIKRKEPTPSY
ncbi:DUF4199 domain-containing protein [Echinicola strongylocentroti]|uniref:DUF4199 domain-containing protein n=1 Tax=Echinicola strongylocentroti TaxID=1795355 RepID=A0A2Z4IH58_9BACT|nr:DUF4199 domain-containing protein [Echinicola strongylocentroti]AWW29753.1 DUF4199 domain-containing protein [Echinicola strongylocentroti]